MFQARQYEGTARALALPRLQRADQAGRRSTSTASRQLEFCHARVTVCGRAASPRSRPADRAHVGFSQRPGKSLPGLRQDGGIPYPDPATPHPQPERDSSLREGGDCRGNPSRAPAHPESAVVHAEIPSSLATRTRSAADSGGHAGEAQLVLEHNAQQNRYDRRGTTPLATVHKREDASHHSDSQRGVEGCNEEDRAAREGARIDRTGGADENGCRHSNSHSSERTHQGAHYDHLGVRSEGGRRVAASDGSSSVPREHRVDDADRGALCPRQSDWGNRPLHHLHEAPQGHGGLATNMAQQHHDPVPLPAAVEARSGATPDVGET
eukprot:PhM_4_TR16800/c1_g2_i3/m.51860